MQKITGRIRPNRRLGAGALCASILTVAALGLTGCKGSAVADDEGDKESGKGLVIGWSQRGISGSDWWKTLVDGGQAEASKMGARLELLDANGDTVRQNADVQTLITKGVDVVVMNPNDPLGVGPSVQALKDAGIPVVTVNSSLDKSLVPDMFCYVAEDQEQTGSLAGEAAAQKALEKYGDKGPIKLVGIGGFPGDVLSDLRFNGFMSGWNRVMEKHPNVTTVKLETKYGEWKPDKALAPIRDVATANRDLKVIYSMSDVMHGGIVQGLQQAGLWGDGIIMASYDGGMGAIKEMVDDPKGPLQADASNQPWDQGAAAVRMALAAFNGDQSQCADKTNYIDTTLITPANAAEYYNPEHTYVRGKD